MNRVFISAFCLGLSTSAFAVFEQIFVADTGTDSIHRFNGDTGAYLGAIGNGILVDPKGVALDIPNNRLVVTASNGIFQFDISSGDLLNMTSFGEDQHIAYSGSGKFLMSRPGLQSVFDGLTTGSDNSYLGQSMPFTTNYGGIARASTTYLVAMDAKEKQLRVFNYGGIGGSSSLDKSWRVDNATDIGQVSIGMFGDVIAADGALNRIYHAHIVWGGNRSIGFFTATEFSSVAGVAFAGGQNYYASGRNAANTSGVLVRKNSGFLGTFGTFGLGILQQPRDIAVIAAPEPAQFAAIGLGILGILFKKRKKA